MANPQKEKGYTAIANEILEALARTPISGSSRQLIFFILRKTYGYHKKADAISFSQFQEGTNLSRRTVIYGLQELEIKKIILVKRTYNQPNIYIFNKDYEQWIVQNSAPLVQNNRKQAKNRSAKLRTSAKLRKEVVQNSVKSLPSFAPTKETVKETVTKEILPSSTTTGFKDEVNLIFDAFYKSINPQLNYARKDSRDAAQWLINKYGFDMTLKAAQYACQIFAQTYAPQITTPAQLKDKWAALVKFKIGKNSAQEKNVVYDE